MISESNKNDEIVANGQDAQCLPFELRNFLLYRFSLFVERMSQALAERYRDKFGLTIPQWRVLAILGERSPRTTAEIIAATRMDPVKVSRAIIRLDAAKLVQRQALPSDQRAYVVKLTNTGGVVYRQIVPFALEMQNKIMSVVSAEEMAMLDDVMNKLLAIGHIDSIDKYLG